MSKVNINPNDLQILRATKLLRQIRKQLCDYFNGRREADEVFTWFFMRGFLPTKYGHTWWLKQSSTGWLLAIYNFGCPVRLELQINHSYSYEVKLFEDCYVQIIDDMGECLDDIFSMKEKENE